MMEELFQTETLAVCPDCGLKYESAFIHYGIPPPDYMGVCQCECGKVLEFKPVEQETRPLL